MSASSITSISSTVKLKPGYGPGVLQGRDIMWTTKQANITIYLPRLTFTAPDGTEYELCDKATNGGQPIQHISRNCGKILVSPNTSVELPDGRAYELRYNPWGELARVETPTGGAIEYDYDSVLNNKIDWFSSL